MKLKVNYDTYGAYVDYNGEHYHIYLGHKNYVAFTIKEIIYEPIDTYIVIEERK